MLTKAMILRILDELSWETVYEDTQTLRLQRRAYGYAKDAGIGEIQAGLSIMLAAIRED